MKLERGDTVKVSCGGNGRDGHTGLVFSVDPSAPRSCEVGFPDGEWEFYLECFLALVSRPSQGQRLEPVEPETLKAGDTVWAKVVLRQDGAGCDWATLRLTEEIREPGDFCRLVDSEELSVAATTLEQSVAAVKDRIDSEAAGAEETYQAGLKWLESCQYATDQAAKALKSATEMMELKHRDQEVLRKLDAEIADAIDTAIAAIRALED